MERLCVSKQQQQIYGVCQAVIRPAPRSITHTHTHSDCEKMQPTFSKYHFEMKSADTQLNVSGVVIGRVVCLTRLVLPLYTHRFVLSANTNTRFRIATQRPAVGTS